MNKELEYLEEKHGHNSWAHYPPSKEKVAQWLQEYTNKQLRLYGVSNWVAIESKEQPEIMTDVMVKYKDGRKEVAYFDGDKRFYIEKDDRDITETIIEWHKLP